MSDDYASKIMADEGSYASHITREALASWERRKMEAVSRWGSLGRLSGKCSPETAAKFAKANGRFKDAKLSTDEFELARRAGVMERGVEAMEAEALQNGYAPSDMTWFDLCVKVEGKRAVAVLNPKDVDYVAAALGRELGERVVVYTAADIVLMAQENQTLLHHLKHKIGAYTTTVAVGGNEEAPW